MGEKTYRDDEIDLVDLAGVIVRRWRWICGTVIAALALASLYSFLQTPQYSYTSMVKIGKYQNHQDDFQFVQQPKAAAESLKAAARTVYNNWKQRHSQDELLFSIQENNFTVHASDDGGILELELNAAKGEKPHEFLDSIISDLKETHNRIFDVISQKYHQRIQTLEAALSELQGKTNSYKRRLKLLDKEKTFLKKQIEESTARIDRLLENKAAANVSNPQEPVGLLLFSSEIQRVRSYVDELQNRLISEIPNKKESLQLDLESVQSQIRTKKAELNAQKVALNNMVKTHMILQPTISDNPVSPKLKLHLALSVVAGGFLGIFLAFLREFWINNRERLLHSEL